ncbi:MAG: alkaline phosphatase family protein [Gemmatimonadota bacterium]|nr:alkaline phosphatase family protein [Gemmatimonadota bacterium]
MNPIAQRILTRLRRPASVGNVNLPDEFVWPAYDGYSLPNVAPTVLRHFRIGGIRSPWLAEEVVGGELVGAEKLVVTLVDALGYLTLTRAMDSGTVPGFHALAERGRFVPLTSVFPSTTAAALSSFHTGLPPAGHGVAGYRMYMPDRGYVANMIRLSPEADERFGRMLLNSGDARTLLGVPTVHRLLTAAGISSYCMIHRSLAHSGLSEMLYDGATDVIPFVNASDLFIQVRSMLTSDPGRPACIWLYTDTMDTIQHKYGTRGDEPEGEIYSLGYSLERELLAPLEGRDVNAALMLLADHGHIQVDEEDIVQVAEVPGLKRLLAAPPTGTARSAYFHARAGAVTDVMSALETGLAGSACIVETRRALAGGLWGNGPRAPELSGRIGDVLALMRGSATLFHAYRDDAVPSDIAGGRHGGLHEREMLIPFFIARLGKRR